MLRKKKQQQAEPEQIGKYELIWGLQGLHLGRTLHKTETGGVSVMRAPAVII